MAVVAMVTQCPLCMFCSYRMRLRKKQWRNPVVIYTDEMVVGKDFQVFLNMEYFIEKLAGVSEYDAGLHVLYRGWGDMLYGYG